MNITFSVIIPCYNEEAVLAETYKRMTAVMTKMAEPYELIFVNDGSRDKTGEILYALADKDKSVRVIQFARNAGHQMAVSAGLDYATGDAVVIIDADLQDPPELIPEMAKMWRDGNDVVYGQRKKREGETAFKKMTAHVYYRVLGYMTGNAIPQDTGDFRLVDKKVADVIRGMPEHARFLRGMFSWVGFKQAPCYYDRDKRFAGETHYPLKKMVKLAIDGICSFSSKPLKAATLLGIFWTCAGLLTGLVLLICLLCGVQGGLWWLAALLMLLSGNILWGLGIAGAYISRIYDETRARPLYIVADTRGFSDDE